MTISLLLVLLLSLSAFADHTVSLVTVHPDVPTILLGMSYSEEIAVFTSGNWNGTCSLVVSGAGSSTFDGFDGWSSNTSFSMNYTRQEDCYKIYDVSFTPSEAGGFEYSLYCDSNHQASAETQRLRVSPKPDWVEDKVGGDIQTLTLGEVLTITVEVFVRDITDTRVGPDTLSCFINSASVSEFGGAWYDEVPLTMAFVSRSGSHYRYTVDFTPSSVGLYQWVGYCHYDENPNEKAYASSVGRLEIKDFWVGDMTFPSVTPTILLGESHAIEMRVYSDGVTNQVDGPSVFSCYIWRSDAGVSTFQDFDGWDKAGGGIAQEMTYNRIEGESYIFQLNFIPESVGGYEWTAYCSDSRNSHQVWQSSGNARLKVSPQPDWVDNMTPNGDVIEVMTFGETLTITLETFVNGITDSRVGPDSLVCTVLSASVSEFGGPWYDDSFTNMTFVSRFGSHFRYSFGFTPASIGLYQWTAYCAFLENIDEKQWQPSAVGRLEVEAMKPTWVGNMVPLGVSLLEGDASLQIQIEVFSNDYTDADDVSSPPGDLNCNLTYSQVDNLGGSWLNQQFAKMDYQYSSGLRYHYSIVFSPSPGDYEYTTFCFFSGFEQQVTYQPDGNGQVRAGLPLSNDNVWIGNMFPAAGSAVVYALGTTLRVAIETYAEGITEDPNPPPFWSCIVRVGINLWTETHDYEMTWLEQAGSNDVFYWDWDL
eukprot:Lithocolla_globosa_v1_NODE_74_length_6885_cov_10.215813.p1 type:complete len:704 gc:universal NODE_74_length_6885_cov_10.215813:5659-3548(-)